MQKSRVRRQPVTPKNDRKVTESTIVCSKHFSPGWSNYINFSLKKRALKDDVVPTFSSWAKTKRRKAPKRRYETSETETEQSGNINDKNIQVEFPIACTHQFSTEVIKSSDQTVPSGEVWWGFIVFAAMVKIN